MERKICALCLIGVADKTGSHILPHFLLKYPLSVEGKPTRDKELIFLISSTQALPIFFGRSVSEDELKAIYGETLTDEDIKAKINPTTVDYLLCSNCEQWLGTIESDFASKIYQKLTLKRVEFTYNKKGQKSILIHDNNEIFNLRIFIYSLIWRASITNFIGFKIKIEEENILRNILNNAKNGCLETSSEEIKSLPLSIIFNEGTIQEKERNALIPGKSKKPYFWIINDLIVKIWFKEKDLKVLQPHIFGLDRFINKDELINKREVNFTIGYLPSDHWQVIYNNVHKELAESMLSWARSRFITLHRKLKIPIRSQDWESFKLKLTDESTPISERYTKNRMAKIMEEIVRTRMRF